MREPGFLISGAAWPLVARDAERRIVVDGVVDGGVRAAVVTGRAGVGKTRLAREALAVAQERGLPTAWATATAAARSVPLGALAHLVPTAPATASTLALLQHAASAIAGDDPERRPVLCVDNAHLLDSLSVTLVHHLAATGTVALVLTVRDEAPPTSFSTLWKDGLAERVELHDLARPDVDSLLHEVLRGDLDSRTAERLWRLSLGNPQLLSELVEEGHGSGLLCFRDGLWRWDGPMRPTRRLTEIVLDQLAAVGDDEWGALELLAIAEPLGLPELVRLSGRNAVTSLERKGLIVVDRNVAPAEVRVARPLHAAVLRAQVPAAEVSAICRRLIEGSEPPAGPNLADAAAVLLDGDPVDLDPELLTVAAEQACAAADHLQAERLARSAVGQGGGFRAHLALVEAVRWQGRATEAAELAHAAAGLAGTDQERARLAVTSSLAVCCGLGRVNEAETALQEAMAGVRDTEARRELAGAAALLALLGGDPRRAVRIAGEASATADGAPAHPLAAAAAAGGLAIGGRADEALAAVASGRDVLEWLPAHLAMLPAAVLDQAETLALWLRGRIDDLVERAAEFHRRTMDAPESPRDAYAALNQGWAALAAGRPRSAVRWLGEAVALLRRCDPAGLLPLGATNLALARALLGEVDAARELLADAAGDTHPAAVVLQSQAQMAEAWIAATVGRISEAADLAADAAQLAAASGQHAVEAVVLHDAVRFGHPARVRGRLRALADELGSPLVEAFARHGEAATDGSAADLEEAGRRFADMGARLLAAEAIAEAAAAHARAGNRGIASARSADAMRLVQACEGAQSPSLARLDAPHLTPREEEVALLAEDGLDNQSIARRLVLSVRTVEKHLENAYTKLGIGSRSELRDALGSPVSAVSEAVPEQRRSGRDSAAAQYRRLRVD